MRPHLDHGPPSLVRKMMIFFFSFNLIKHDGKKMGGLHSNCRPLSESTETRGAQLGSINAISLGREGQLYPSPSLR